MACAFVPSSQPISSATRFATDLLERDSAMLTAKTHKQHKTVLPAQLQHGEAVCIRFGRSPSSQLRAGTSRTPHAMSPQGLLLAFESAAGKLL